MTSNSFERSRARTIAIGDVHGCSRQLEALLGLIAPREHDCLVFLGDYVNRGPDSRGVIDLVLEWSKWCQVVPLLGNHDQVLLDALDAGQFTPQLAKRRGQNTLDSYGIGSTLADIPPEHQSFLRGCRLSYETDSTLFAHAGYDPQIPLEATSPEVLVWARLEPPYPAPHVSGKRAIVGHTAQRSFEVLDLGHVVCIDTGCCYGGKLTALDADSGQIWQVGKGCG